MHGRHAWEICTRGGRRVGMAVSDASEDTRLVMCAGIRSALCVSTAVLELELELELVNSDAMHMR